VVKSGEDLRETAVSTYGCCDAFGQAMSTVHGR
jgi:hypothetical protein